MIAYFWSSASHLETFSLAFESIAGAVELVLAICFARTVFALRNEPSEEIRRQKERLEAALGLVAGIFFVVAIAACWRIVILSKNERMEAQQQLSSMANDLAIAKQSAVDASNALTEARAVAARQKPRSFSEQQKQLAQETLAVYSGTDVYITSSTDDPDSVDFAPRLSELLNSCGWKTSGIDKAIFRTEPHGVEVVAHSIKNASAVSSLVSFLNGCGISATPFKSSNSPGSDISIIIGPK